MMSDDYTAPANHTKPPHVQKRRRWLLAALYASIGLFVIGGVFLVTSIFDLVSSIREDQKVNASTNRAVLDCTVPEGECAKRSAEATGQAVSSIGQLSVYASACAADVDGSLPVRVRVRQIERCVTALLEEPPQAPAVP